MNRCKLASYWSRSNQWEQSTCVWILIYYGEVQLLKLLFYIKQHLGAQRTIQNAANVADPFPVNIVPYVSIHMRQEYIK